MNTINQDLTIFVSSPNQYADVFSVFYQCLKKYWKDCPYQVILSTNNQEYDGITVFNNYRSSDSWTERIIPDLEKVSSKYILLLCDDIFLKKNVETKRIQNIVSNMEDYHINFCRLKPYKKGKVVSGTDDLIYINKRAPYSRNLQKGIYNRKYLLELLGDGERSAWQIERDWVSDSLNAPDELFDDIVSVNKDVLPSYHGVDKGKWFPSVLRNLKKNGIEVCSERGRLTNLQEIKIIIISKMGYMLPPKKKMKIKKILSKMGFRFDTEC